MPVQEVLIREVGPRDGLQNEKEFVPTADKVAWIDMLSQAGLSYIEVSSFVHPRWIPPLADADDVFRSIHRLPHVTYAGLVPNMRGFERAMVAEVDEVVVFLSASQSHNHSNLNKSLEDSLRDCKEVAQASGASNRPVRAYLSTAFGCPFEGKVSHDVVLRMVETLLSAGVHEVSIADTIGVATPGDVRELVPKIQGICTTEQVALHFHDTRGTGLANVLAALDLGIYKFDSSLGGLGGCPYAPGAAGNVCTEDLLYMLHGMNITTNVDEERVMAAAHFIQQRLDKSLPSHLMKVQHNLSSQ